MRFSEVLVKWRRFFHRMAAEEGQAGRAVLDTKLEVEKLQVRPCRRRLCCRDALLEVALDTKVPEQP